MGDLALIALAIGVGGQAYSTYQQGKEQEKQYKKSAAILAAQAEREKEVSLETAREKRKEKRALTSKQIALYAKSGMAPGIGTPLLVTEYSGKQMERHARIITEHGAFAYQRGMAGAALEKRKGKAAYRAGVWGAGTTLATGLGQAGLAYHKYG